MLNRVQNCISSSSSLLLDSNKSAEEITSQLFASLNLTTANFGGQLNNVEAYRSALDKVIRAAIVSANQTTTSSMNAPPQQEPETFVQIENEQQPQTSKSTTATATTDTREYTEKRRERRDE